MATEQFNVVFNAVVCFLIVALLCLGSSEAITLTKKSHSKEDPPAEEAPAEEAAEPAEAAPAKKEEKKGDKKDAAK